jgi:DNA-binding Xre family transcriptional regulator
MKTSYNNLWKLLIDNNMQKKDLIDKLGISSTTIAKMGKGEKVSLDVLERICEHFDCNIGDVISFEKEN